MFGGAVVLFQFHNFDRIRAVVALEIQDVFDVGPPKGIDTLGIVADHTNILVNSRQLPGNEILGYVGILKFIDHDVLKLVLVFVENIHMIAKQHVGIEQQIVEIHRIGRKASAAVFFINPAHLRHPRRFIIGFNNRIR